MQNLANFDRVLKVYYLGPIRKQLNESTVLLKKLQRDSESVSGKNATIPLHFGRNEGIGARPDGGALPAAGRQSYLDTIVPMKYNYARIYITGPTIEASRNNTGAFVRAVESEIKGALRDAKKDMNRQLWGDGSGALAVCDDTAANHRVVVDSTRFLTAGQLVDIRVLATGATIQNGEAVPIIAVTGPTTFTVANAVTTTKGAHVVTRAGSVASVGGVYTSYEMNGLANIVSQVTTCQGIDPAIHPWWAAADVDATTNVIDYSDMQAMIDAIEANDSTADVIITSYPIRRKYLDLLTPDVRFVDTNEGKGGLMKLSFNNIPVEVDPDIPSDFMYFLDSDTMKIYRHADWNWMDRDGSTLKYVSGFDAYEAVLYHYGNLGVHKRNGNAVMTAITP